MGAHPGSQREEGENHYIPKRGKREPINQNFLETFKSKKKNPKVLEILKFRGNIIDWDCKIVKGNSEKQENRFAKQFSREFIDKKAKSGKNLSIETRRGVFLLDKI